MKYEFQTGRVLALLLVFIFGYLHSADSYSISADSAGLLSEVNGKSVARLPAQAIAGRSHAVAVNRAEMRSGRFDIRLPRGLQVRAVREQQLELGQGRVVWMGHIEGRRSERVVVSASGAAVAASIAHAGKLYKLEPRADGSHVFSEVLANEPAPLLDPIPVEDPGAVDSGTAADSAASASGVNLDVLVAYTPAVEALYGTAGVEALAQLAVAETNQAYVNSGIAVRLSLVHLARANYTESGSMHTDLVRLRHASDGYMDDIHQLRDLYKADLVSLIENEPASCGLAYRMAGLSSAFASSAFSVVHHSCATGYFSFGHELGHNQGAHHDHANASDAIYPYAYGYTDAAAGFRTIMAYNCPGGCVRVSHFSNPEVSFNNSPTGLSGYADNRQTLNDTAAVVASFRQTPQTAPSDPADLQARAMDAGAISLSWQDTSDNESGFIVERRLAGGVYAAVATVPANTTTHLDNGLQADTLYYYRVKAWNSEGDSAYSPEAVAATDTIASGEDGLIVAQSDMSVAGLVFGAFTQTWNADGAAQRLQEQSSPGAPSGRYGLLEHQWIFQVPTGGAAGLFATVGTGAQDESFTFAYSLDGSHFTDMFTVSAAPQGMRYFKIPMVTSGTVYVRVRDDRRLPGLDTSHAIDVDQLFIVPEGHQALPSTLPPGC